MAKLQLNVPKKQYKNEQKTIKYCSIELYTETESYNFKKVFEKIKDYCNQNQASYVSMLHDSDYYTEDTFDHNLRLVGRKGQKKANHVHCLISFGKRVDLNGFANNIGIEERWIKILKHDYDFDNMIVYLTHVKYDESVKHHYSPTLFDSNILDYCNFIYDHAVAELESKEANIISFCRDVINENKDRRISLAQMLDCILTSDYEINEYNKYYRIIKDLVMEHNQQFQIETDVEKYKDQLQMLHGYIAELDHNIEVLNEINMELRGIAYKDSKQNRW